jgi:hypothetical protein
MPIVDPEHVRPTYTTSSTDEKLDEMPSYLRIEFTAFPWPLNALFTAMFSFLCFAAFGHHDLQYVWAIVAENSRNKDARRSDSEWHFHKRQLSDRINNTNIVVRACSF